MNLDNILTLKDAEETARSVLPGNIFNMIQGGAMYEHTVMENELTQTKGTERCQQPGRINTNTG